MTAVAIYEMMRPSVIIIKDPPLSITAIELLMVETNDCEESHNKENTAENEIERSKNRSISRGYE